MDKLGVALSYLLFVFTCDAAGPFAFGCPGTIHYCNLVCRDYQLDYSGVCEDDICMCITDSMNQISVEEIIKENQPTLKDAVKEAVKLFDELKGSGSPEMGIHLTSKQKRDMISKQWVKIQNPTTEIEEASQPVARVLSESEFRSKRNNI